MRWAKTVTVVGAHGWSSASTTALLLAESAARAGWTVRLVDAADPVQSGLIGAAVTEHGHDQSGHWRRGTRGVAAGGRQPGQLRLERLDRAAAAPLAVPAAATSDPGDGPVEGAVYGAALTVVDAGWPLHELLKLAQDPVGRTHWLARLICSSPLVLSARATVPGVQRAAVAADQLQSMRTGGQTLTKPPVSLSSGVGSCPTVRVDGYCWVHDVSSFSSIEKISPALSSRLRTMQVRLETSTSLAS